MKRGALLCLFGVILVAPLYGQTDSGTAAAPSQPVGKSMSRRVMARPNGKPKKAARYKPDVTLNSPIVTLDGVCPQQPKGAVKQGTDCKTVITRAQLDVLQDVIDPDALPKARQQFAITYARLLAAAELAEQQRLDLIPEVANEIQAQQKLVRLQILSNVLMERVQKRAAIVPNKELDDYYKKYASTFEHAQVRRLAIPLDAHTESGKPLDVEAAKAKMEELRTRVLAGDDFDELQARAYKELEIKGDLPPTSLNIAHLESLSPEQAKVFEMDLGETSPVFENQGALMLLRVISRRTLPLAEVQPQIEAVMYRQRVAEELQEATKGVTAEFNLKYMESKTQPDLFPPSVLTQPGLRRGMLSSLHLQQ